MVAGTAYAHTRFRMAPQKFRRAVIQITTVGREAELVRATVNAIRDYGLPFDHEIWVVNEPGHDNRYPMADRVITVPKEFQCRPIDKARALEYTRRIRRNEGLNTADVKIILIDDDTLPTREYFMKAFAGDYDLCQGATVPNREYATGGWRHYLISHFDNIRVRNCLIYCSCTQGITGKPLFVHGEGLTITGLVEDRITWDHPIIASDDLVFGTRAAHAGFTWGYFNAAIQLVSPWSFKDAWHQRKRWTWGNFSAIGSRDILPLSVALPKGLKYLLGCLSIFASTTGAILLWTGVAKVPSGTHTLFVVSLVSWFLSYGLAGWINSGGESNRRRFIPVDRPQERRPDEVPGEVKYYAWRALQTVVAMVLCPPTAMLPIVIILGSLVTGKPRRFIVIAKTNRGSRDEAAAAVRDGKVLEPVG